MTPRRKLDVPVAKGITTCDKAGERPERRRLWRIPFQSPQQALPQGQEGRSSFPGTMHLTERQKDDASSLRDTTT